MVKVISEVCISSVVVFADGGGVSWGKCPTFHMRISSRDSFSVQKYILFIGENFGSIYTTHRRQGARPPTVARDGKACRSPTQTVSFMWTDQSP